VIHTFSGVSFGNGALIMNIEAKFQPAHMYLGECPLSKSELKVFPMQWKVNAEQGAFGSKFRR
jgi:hypothetical protein